MSELWLSGDPALAPSSLQLSLDHFLDEQLGPKRKLYLANGSSWVCKFFAKGQCLRGMECPYRHSRGDKPFVCKFWLRGQLVSGGDHSVATPETLRCCRAVLVQFRPAAAALVHISTRDRR